MEMRDTFGFIPGREGKDNGVRALLLLQQLRERGTPGLLLSVDAEKAFDRVDWGFLIQTLEAIGIGTRMMKWIKTLYYHPCARIKINGSLSVPFEMRNGTRQGCPLSPLLFVLTLEPLLAMVRQNQEIYGVEVGEEEHKLSAFADDVLFFICSPRVTLPNLIATLRQYGEVSNFKMNTAKTEILNVNIHKEEEQYLRKKYTFSWQKEINYLGIKLANTLKKIYRINYIPLLDEIKKEIKNIYNRPMSWFGRINVAKMILIPKIIYKFQMLPIYLPPPYVKILNSLIMNYIWNNKKHRISAQTLKRAKDKGGLAVPDIRMYYNAF